jgi:hypothetical protein
LPALRNNVSNAAANAAANHGSYSGSNNGNNGAYGCTSGLPRNGAASLYAYVRNG